MGTLTKIELQKLRLELPTGAQTIISKRSGYTAQYVGQVLNGKRESLEIINIAIQLRDENKEKIKGLKKQLHA